MSIVWRVTVRLQHMNDTLRKPTLAQLFHVWKREFLKTFYDLLANNAVLDQNTRCHKLVELKIQLFKRLHVGMFNTYPDGEDW